MADRKSGPAKGEGGAPRKEIDLVAVERAAGIGCAPEEIAAICGVGRSTFYDHMQVNPEIQKAIDRGRELGRGTLRRLQWQRANAGDTTMLIWLGKIMLRQKEPEREVRIVRSVSDITDDELLALTMGGERPPADDVTRH